MNFWRVPIDENTGRTAGDFEAVTTPSGYSEHISFSADGRQMAYVQRAERKLSIESPLTQLCENDGFA